jgi:hypothetical protein
MSDDMTPEAVERLAKTLEAFNGDGYTRFKGMTMCERSAATLRALSARLAELEAERDSAIRGRNDWRDDYKALSSAIVGETGLSAMTVATQARLFRPRAEAAEAALATARADALREAAEAIKTDYRISSVIIDGVEVFGCEAATPASCYEAILALIPKEQTNDR